MLYWEPQKGFCTQSSDAWSSHMLALLIKEAAAIPDLQKPQRNPRQCTIYMSTVLCKLSACKASCNAGLQRASEGYPHTILLVPHAWSLHALALLVEEAATIQDLWKPQRHSRHC